MKKTLTCLLASFALMTSSAAFVGCEREGPAERAGEQIDEAAEEVGEDLEEAGDELD